MIAPKSTIVLIAVLSSSFLSADMTPSPEGAWVYIVSPADGDTVQSTFTIQFGLKGMGVSPAGIDVPNTGHHHLLIDASKLPPLNEPMGDAVRHFGGGQTEVEISLAPGRHALQLILGDKLHIPHSPPVVSDKIFVTVK
ncbi:MAG: DUF4399 domain-containing protein [Pseudomonadales bacterium]|jgi:hypothetical protein|nr:DUF4399 domain-containing protein [Pseudomonadales bacterium]MDP7595039.1 DUF4399 domain-containing protein [Pseudomonadales bacterium]HJN51404.1 DUF4399 domain-containing protein [Pseudomonadales bacterium]|tara:strand:+ start:1303 stop:1719 length:417 start_codon:yes stop_codon:yes gene_type:complete